MTRDEEEKDVILKVGERLAVAFKKSTFVYGTQGKGSAAVGAAKIWASHHFSNDQQKVGRELNLFDPGIRAEAYNKGDGFQMMDMYYGQAGNQLFRKRDPAIAEYIHLAMKYKGTFSMNQSGRDAFLATYGRTYEGWDGRGPKINGNTATVEISRLIRRGIERFGGKLIFEGKWVYYSQVFNTKGYKSDTDREAVGLFSFFRGDSSAQFGKGKIIFNWNGKQIVPTHCHFLSNWAFPANDKGQLLRVKQTVALLEQAAARTGPAVPALAAKEPWMIGALQHNPLTRGNLESWLKQGNVELNQQLWNRFKEKPAGLEHIPTEKILALFAKGLNLGYI